MQVRIFNSCYGSCLIALALLGLPGCKTVNRAGMDSERQGRDGAGNEFVSMLVGHLDRITAGLLPTASRPSQDGSPQFPVFKAFVANEKLTPYAKAAEAIDEKRDKELSRQLANSVRTMLANWYKQCSIDAAMQKEWAYPALCRDFSKSGIIDEAADLSLIADIISEIERQRGMPAHLAIYYEIRHVTRANKKTLDNLVETCRSLPVDQAQPEKVVAAAKSMPPASLMGEDEMTAIAREGLITIDQLRYLQDVVTPATTVLQDAMSSFETEMDLYGYGNLRRQESLYNSATKWAYNHGRRSVITSDFYQKNLRPFEPAGIYQGTSPLDYLDFGAEKYPRVNPCASLVFKQHDEEETAGFVQRHLPAIASGAAGKPRESKLATMLMARILGIAPGNALDQ